MTVFVARTLTRNLRAALATSTGRPIGLAEVPVADNQKPSMPYGILYPVGGAVGGSFDQPNEDGQAIYQVTMVADDPDRTEWLWERVRKFFLERDSSGAFVNAIDAGDGRVVIFREMELIGSMDAQTKGLFQVAERYRLWVDRVPA